MDQHEAKVCDTQEHNINARKIDRSAPRAWHGNVPNLNEREYDLVQVSFYNAVKQSVRIFYGVPVCKVMRKVLSQKGVALLASIWILCLLAAGQTGNPAWQEDVRRLVAIKDWAAALRVVDRELARTPNDMDVRAWRARILTWAGEVVAAEEEYHEIMNVVPNDPDNFLGIASVYLREGRPQEALEALDRALELDSQRADLRLARGKALWALGRRSDARLEFERALKENPANVEASGALAAGRSEPKHYLLIAINTDLFSFADTHHDEGFGLTSQWTPHWQTYFAGNHYLRGGVNAEKAIASLTAKWPRLGALTVGGSGGQDNSIIPKAEAFFDYDKGWKLSNRGLFRGLELVYGQHWYWYTTAKILAISETALLYLPNEWTWCLRLSQARSQFYGAGADWRPSGMAKLGFPIASLREQRLNGNVFFVVGTESFGQVDQIGHFASQTYGGTLRLEVTRHQAVTANAAYQKRTDNRSQTSFGFTYGVHF